MGKTQQIIVKDNVPLKLIFHVSFSSGKSNKTLKFTYDDDKKGNIIYTYIIF